MSEDDAPQPPEPPKMKRRLRVWRAQKFGMPILLLFPLLGLSGLADPTPVTRTVEAGGLAVRLDYPPRTRFGADAKLDIRVKNLSPSRLNAVTVTFETAYLEHFESVFKPEVDRAYEVDLVDIAPGEERLVSVDLKAQTIGDVAGGVTVGAKGGEPARFAFSTFILP